MTSVITAAGALLWSGARCAAGGTVLASRLRGLLPGWAAVAVSGAGWFVLGERLEAAHANVPLLAIVVVLALAVWLVLRFASVALRALAGIVFAIVCAGKDLESPFNKFRVTRGRAPHHAARDTVWRARLLRAPPVTANA
jgi:hypothetical protein